MKEYMI